MWRSNGASLRLLAAAAFAGALMAPTPSRAHEATDVPDHDVSAFATSFSSNVGGLPELGARYRGGRFEAIVMSLGNAFAFDVAYSYRMNVGSWFIPRLSLGAGYFYGGLALIPGLELTFPLVSIGSRMELGLELDTYFYQAVYPEKYLQPVIPLCLAFWF